MHEASVKLLNHAVGDELYAVHQYMYFHFHVWDLIYLRHATFLPKGEDFNAQTHDTFLCRFSGSHVTGGAIEPCFCSG